MQEKGIKDIHVRFFVYDEEANHNEGDIVECDEAQFLESHGTISYERHSVFENGCRQICLTKI